MVKIELNKQEIEALDLILNKVECPIKIGFILASMRIKLQQTINADNEEENKKKYAPKKKEEVKE